MAQFQNEGSRYTNTEINCMNLKDICSRAIDSTGKYIAEEQQKFDSSKVETKGQHDFVSFVDKNAEKKLVEAFQILLPGSGFIVEEKTVADNDSSIKWIIDPLDGTTNFIHGLAPYAISVGLMENKELVMGVVYEITRDECFYSWKEEQAFLNGMEIKVSAANYVKNSLIATGFPYYDYDRLPQFMKSLDFFMRNSHGLRRLGSAATDLAYVACGRFDAFYEYSLNSWDVAAGAFIVKQAGGKVCDFSGLGNYLFGKEIIATNSLINEEFIANVKFLMQN
jgi:myo-inositol-1(or 4)-monophosphatase